jgi:hypothetical protein
MAGDWIAVAAQFLQDIRRVDFDQGDNVKLEHEILNWMFDYGQSFEWIVRGDVSGMISHGANWARTTTNQAGEPIPLH